MRTDNPATSAQDRHGSSRSRDWTGPTWALLIGACKCANCDRDRNAVQPQCAGPLMPRRTPS